MDFIISNELSDVLIDIFFTQNRNYRSIKKNSPKKHRKFKNLFADLLLWLERNFFEYRSHRNETTKSNRCEVNQPLEQFQVIHVFWRENKTNLILSVCGERAANRLVDKWANKKLRKNQTFNLKFSFICFIIFLPEISDEEEVI